MHDDYFAGRDPVREAALRYEAPSLATAEVDSAVLAGYAGRYRYSTHQVAEITLDGARLRLRVDDFLPVSVARLRTTLYPTSENTFVAGVPGLRVTFAARGTVVSAMVLQWDEAERMAVRLPDGHRYPVELLREGAIVEGAAAILRDSSYYASAVPGFEANINGLGYRYLREGRADDAITVFRLNVALFPASANTYDSLGEGYLVRGDTAQAIASYRQALALAPDSRNARDVLARLESAP
jgi:tetratricopeptide (TPR) repeat protein